LAHHQFVFLLETFVNGLFIGTHVLICEILKINWLLKQSVSVAHVLLQYCIFMHPNPQAMSRSIGWAHMNKHNNELALCEGQHSLSRHWHNHVFIQQPHFPIVPCFVWTNLANVLTNWKSKFIPHKLFRGNKLLCIFF